jgi:hypothetical protein
MNDENLSYEEEQLQTIIMNEIKEKSLREATQLKDREIQAARHLREQQDIEYQESLVFDLNKDKEDLKEDLNKKDKESDYISIEEMRQIRLNRFA